MAIQDSISDAELVVFLRSHRRIEVVPAGVQCGLFGGDVEMVRLVVGKIGVLASVVQLDRAKQQVWQDGDVVPFLQTSLIAGVNWIPV